MSYLRLNWFTLPYWRVWWVSTGQNIKNIIFHLKTFFQSIATKNIDPNAHEKIFSRIIIISTKNTLEMILFYFQFKFRCYKYPHCRGFKSQYGNGNRIEFQNAYNFLHGVLFVLLCTNVLYADFKFEEKSMEFFVFAKNTAEFEWMSKEITAIK